jgi:hypothetical protein
MLPSSKQWLRLKPILAFAAVQALGFGLAAIVTLTWHGQWAASAWAQASPTATALPALPLLAASDLDGLRNDATIGDLEAGGLLVSQLLQHYERFGNTDDLYEAVQWIDRAWRDGYYQRSGLATRIFERHCSHKVLRWHWLCDTGE